MSISISPERFAQGMTFDQYLDYIATPENLAREGSKVTTLPGSPPQARRDFRDTLRAAYEQRRLSDDQTYALRWLAAQPGGPAKLLVISEEWSSDCRRDLPTLARMAEAGGMELRIFTRDGQRYSEAGTPNPDESPNADLMLQFLRERDGATYQSIPVAAFFDRAMNYLYHYIELPAVYDKDGLVNNHIRVIRPGETPQQATDRSNAEFAALIDSPFFRIWTSAVADEIISALHRRVMLGTA